MNSESIIKELKNIQAHAAMTEHWAGQLIKKLDGQKDRKERRVNGLTHADIARLRAHRMKTILKK